MTKQKLFTQIQNRFPVNIKSEVAIVVSYKGKLYCMPSHKLEWDFSIADKRFTVAQLMPFLKGEVVLEEKTIDPNSDRHQLLTFRAEAPIDVHRLMIALNEEDINIGLQNFSYGDIYGHMGMLYAPAELSLIQIKQQLWDIVQKHNVDDPHVLIQSLDYPIFKTLRDRDSPQPQF
jgi:hypothetical protein